MRAVSPQRPRIKTAGCDNRTLPSCSRGGRIATRPATIGVLLIVLILSGCGAKPPPPTAPIRTHLEEAALLMPRVPIAVPWRRLTFNDWERLRARAGLGDLPVTEWSKDPQSKALATLQSWLVPPSTTQSAEMLAPVGIDGMSLRWQFSLDGERDVPITRLLTAAARDDRPKQIANVLAPLGYPQDPPTAAAPGANIPVVYRRSGLSGTLPPLLDADAAALLVTSTALATVHDASLVPEAIAPLASSGESLDAVPFFHGLIAGISDVEALVIFRVGADGYHDGTAPLLDAPSLPFDAVGSALHITDAGAQYVTLAFHCTALPGGRLPEGMAEWWVTRFGLDQPDPRADYLEAFGNDGWLFARYRILSPEERLGGVPRGEVPFWKSVSTWQTVQQHWVNFAPRTADPIPRLGT